MIQLHILCVQGQPTVQQIKVMEKALKDICYPTKKDFGDAPHTGGTVNCGECLLCKNIKILAMCA